MTEHTGECGHHRWCRCACRPGAMRWAARCRHRQPRVAARAYGVAVTSARARPRGARAGTGLVPRPGRRRRVVLAWPRLPAAVELGIVAPRYTRHALLLLPAPTPPP